MLLHFTTVIQFVRQQRKLLAVTLGISFIFWKVKSPTGRSMAYFCSVYPPGGKCALLVLHMAALMMWYMAYR